MADVEHNTITDANLHVVGYIQSLDPGAVGTGKVWIDIGGGNGAWEIKYRNAADTGWEVWNHKDAHDPEDGADPLDTAAPSELAGVQASAEGSSHSLARADHAHQVQASIADNHLVTIDQADATTTEIARLTATGLESRSDAEIKAQLGYIEDVSEDITPTAGGDWDHSDKDLHNLKQVDFQDTHDNTTSGAAKTIDWNECNVQTVQLTGNVTFTFTAPAGPCGLTLYLTGNGTAYTTTFPASAEFVDDGEPEAWGATSGEIVGIISLRYDSTMTPNYIMSGAARGV